MATRRTASGVVLLRAPALALSCERWPRGLRQRRFPTYTRLAAAGAAAEAESIATAAEPRPNWHSRGGNESLGDPSLEHSRLLYWWATVLPGGKIGSAGGRQESPRPGPGVTAPAANHYNRWRRRYNHCAMLPIMTARHSKPLLETLPCRDSLDVNCCERPWPPVVPDWAAGRGARRSAPTTPSRGRDRFAGRGQSHLASIAHCEGMRLAGLCDVDPAVLAKNVAAAEQHGQRVPGLADVPRAAGRRTSTPSPSPRPTTGTR